MLTLPLLDHPIVLAAAEETAREIHAAIGEVMPDDEAGECWCEWEDEAADHRATRITTHARLLCDLTRPASRDWWVRWGAKEDGDRGVAAFIQAVAEERSRMSDAWMPDPRGEDRARLHAANRWHALRDNPEALAAAILAALDVKS